jgi:hypothetical protein
MIRNIIETFRYALSQSRYYFAFTCFGVVYWSVFASRLVLEGYMSYFQRRIIHIIITINAVCLIISWAGLTYSEFSEATFRWRLFYIGLLLGLLLGTLLLVFPDVALFFLRSMG